MAVSLREMCWDDLWVWSAAMMVTSSSEGTGEEAEAAAWLCTLGSVYSMQSQGQ